MDWDIFVERVQKYIDTLDEPDAVDRLQGFISGLTPMQALWVGLELSMVLSGVETLQTTINMRPYLGDLAPLPKE